VPTHSLESARAAFADLKFTVVTGSRYFGGFIGEKPAFDEWIRKKTKSWTEAVTDLAVVAKNFPQSAYSGLQKSLQQEWQFVQRVKEGVGEKFTAIEEAISNTFLPALFGDEYDEDDPCWKLACLPVKHAGMAIPDPTTSAQSNFEASILLICSHLFAALWGVKVF
jgi:hypothetical protein